MTGQEYAAFYVAEKLSRSRLLRGSEAFEAYKFFAGVVRKHEGLIGSEEFVSLVRKHWADIKLRVPAGLLGVVEEQENDVDDDCELMDPFGLFPDEPFVSNPNDYHRGYGIDSFIAPVMRLLWGNVPRISHDDSNGVPL